MFIKSCDVQEHFERQSNFFKTFVIFWVRENDTRTFTTRDTCYDTFYDTVYAFHTTNLIK